MAKSENQKYKLMSILNILYRKTDENHSITTQGIIDELAKEGIKAERKSIYADVLALQDIGIEVNKVEDKKGGYYIADRDFELAELKVLVDVLQSARFLTEKKTDALIKKIEALASDYQAKELQHNVVLSDRPKTDNENIFYNVDEIYRAISENKQVTFYYYEWNDKKELVPRHDGKPYVVSPWQLIWDNENYYLMAFEEQSNQMKHYRVDKMKKLSIEEKERLGKELMQDFNPADFSKTTFGMFAGETKTVSLKISKPMISIMIDRFGKDVTLRPLFDEEEKYEVRTTVNVSNQFFGWLAGLGGGAQIISPAETKEAYRAFLETNLKSI